MSSAGIHAGIYQDGIRVAHALLIGAMVPRIHMTDDLPVYFLIEHEEGVEIMLRNRQIKRLLAYPSSWPCHGRRSGNRTIYGTHEDLAFNSPIPIFDETGDDDAKT